MNLQLPAELSATIQSFVASGQYKDETAVSREALTKLKQREDDLSSISEGYEDMLAGRVRPWTEVKAELDAKHSHDGK